MGFTAELGTANSMPGNIALGYGPLMGGGTGGQTSTGRAAGDLFRMEVQRIGADVADTYVGVVNLLGLIVSYTANQ